jgi:hypothetical protein
MIDDLGKRLAAIVIFFAIVFLGACESAQSPANAGGECSSDANCTLGSWTPECCPRCKPYSAPYAEVNALDMQCTATVSPPTARCPALECPAHEGPDWIAKCVSGRCVVGP